MPLSTGDLIGDSRGVVSANKVDNNTFSQITMGEIVKCEMLLDM